MCAATHELPSRAGRRRACSRAQVHGKLPLTPCRHTLLHSQPLRRLRDSPAAHVEIYIYIGIGARIPPVRRTHGRTLSSGVSTKISTSKDLQKNTTNAQFWWSRGGEGGRAHTHTHTQVMRLCECARRHRHVLDMWVTACHLSLDGGHRAA